MTKETEDKTVQDAEQSAGNDRRSAVKKIVLATGIVTTSQFSDLKWVKPVVDAVVVPAHAQASPGGPGGY